MLKIEHLTKRFGKVIALNNINLEVKPGEIFALVGPNGSGKTTLLKTVAGLLRPNKGKILVGGLDVTVEPVKTKSLIGYIPDEPSIWHGMTGEEFLYFTGALYGISPEERKKRISLLLATFKLGNIGEDYFEDYSRGNKQKFTIMAALLHSPKLLLIDEPIVGLDPSSGLIAKQEFIKFAKEGGAVILATHTLSVAEEIASRIGLLKEGTFIAVGKIDELRKTASLKSKAGLEEIYNALIN